MPATLKVPVIPPEYTCVQIGSTIIASPSWLKMEEDCNSLLTGAGNGQEPANNGMQAKNKRLTAAGRKKIVDANTARHAREAAEKKANQKTHGAGA